MSGIGAVLGRHDLDRNESGRRPHPAGFGGTIMAINLGGCMTSVPYRWLRLPLPRKEVIQPHLPVRLPCYDFVPVTNPTFDGCLLAVGPPASGVIGFHDVTGGVYKARERIQRRIADRRLLATPTSWRRVAASNLN